MATIYFVILWSFDQTNATQIIFKHGEPERVISYSEFQRKDLNKQHLFKETDAGNAGSSIKGMYLVTRKYIQSCFRSREYFILLLLKSLRPSPWFMQAVAPCRALAVSSEQYEGSTSSHAPASVTGAVTERGDTGANIVTRRANATL